MMMFDIRRTSQFKKDLKKAIKQGKDLSALEKVIKLLQAEKSLPEVCCDHALVGNWSGYRECHVNPDWLLIYKLKDKLELLRLARIGSHADLFK